MNGFVVDWTATMLLEIRDKHATRNQVADSYALALRRPDMDWPTVNKAIIERWSVSALRYIKRRAWNIKETGIGVFFPIDGTGETR